MDSQTTKKMIIKLVFTVVVVLVVVGLIYYSPKEVKEVKEIDEILLAEDVALNLVTAQPEVAEWLALFSEPNQTSLSTGGQVKIVLDSEKDGVYLFHLIESFPEQDVTFNWYEVDLEKETVKKIVE